MATARPARWRSRAGGEWDGPWSDAFQYGLVTIKGVSYPFDPPSSYTGKYWSIYLNGYAAPSGICGFNLQPADSLVVAAINDSDPNGLLNLSGVPLTAAPGSPVTVTVNRSATTYSPPDFLPVNSEEPAKDATVQAGGTSATTGADGKATLTLTQRGPVAIRATKAGEVRSATESICVTDGADGYCGTIKPGETTSPTSPPAAAQSAVVDRDVPFGSVGSIPEQQHFKRGKAPRELSGAVDGEPSGIKDIRLRLTRRVGKRCERLDSARERWVKAARCGADNSPFFSIGDRTPWSYLLPQALTKGRYVLDVQVADRAGNVRRGNTRGGVREQRNRVVFFVD